MPFLLQPSSPKLSGGLLTAHKHTPVVCWAIPAGGRYRGDARLSICAHSPPEAGGTVAGQVGKGQPLLLFGHLPLSRSSASPFLCPYFPLPPTQQLSFVCSFYLCHIVEAWELNPCWSAPALQSCPVAVLCTGSPGVGCRMQHQPDTVTCSQLSSSFFLIHRVGDKVPVIILSLFCPHCDREKWRNWLRLSALTAAPFFGQRE